VRPSAGRRYIVAAETCGTVPSPPEAIQQFDRAEFEEEIAEHPVTRFSEGTENHSRCAFSQPFIALEPRGPWTEHRNRVDDTVSSSRLATTPRPNRTVRVGRRLDATCQV
jgi:hypothetical protein